MNRNLRTRTLKGALLAAFFVVAGTVTHPDPDRPNLRMIIGVGCYLLAAAMCALGVLLAVRFRTALLNPRTLKVAPSADAEGAEGRILITRSVDTAADFVRRYVVRVDGKTAGELKLGDRLEVRIQPGQHVISAEIAGNRSSEVRFVSAPGEQTVFTVEPTAGSNAARRAGEWLAVVPANRHSEGSDDSSL